MKLYVGNLGDDGAITSRDLRPLFQEFGNVTECECIKNYAFVHLDTEEGGNQAVEALNGKNVNGRNIKVEKSESKGPRKPSHKLFVGNIQSGTTSEDLREIFAKYCHVVEADVIKNFGFVHVDADTTKSKISEILKELNGYDLNGSPLRVQLSTSGVRQTPGMGGNDGCFRCGRSGHWSKECRSSGGDGMRSMGGGRGGGRGDRRGPPFRGGGRDRGGGRSFRGGRGATRDGGPYAGSRSDPYPPPPPPSYMRERMMNNYGANGGDDGYAGGYGGGYGNQGGYGASGSQVGGGQGSFGGTRPQGGGGPGAFGGIRPQGAPSQAFGGYGAPSRGNDGYNRQEGPQQSSYDGSFGGYDNGQSSGPYMTGMGNASGSYGNPQSGPSQGMYGQPQQGGQSYGGQDSSMYSRRSEGGGGGGNYGVASGGYGAGRLPQSVGYGGNSGQDSRGAPAAAGMPQSAPAHPHPSSAPGSGSSYYA